MTIISSPHTPRSLDEQQREFAQRRGLANPLAGAVAWTIVGVAGFFSAAHPEGVVPLPNAQIVAECRGLAPLARRHALVSTEARLARPVDIPNWPVEPRLEMVKAGDGGRPAGLTTSLHRL